MRDLSRVREILKSGRARGAAPAGPVPGGGPVELGEVAARLGGELCENEGGRYVLVRSRYNGLQVYGGSPIADYAALDGEGLRVLGNVAPAPVPVAEGPVRFVDLETTGLSGGAGTVAFLIGVGFFDGGDFHVNQYVLPSLGAERAQLMAAGEVIRASRALVTFNGKSFDVPVMETRWAMHRMSLPWTNLPHVDLLPPARRLWRRRDCRLTALEKDVLGLTRDGDVPGAEIPSRYVGYLRRGDPAPLVPVLEHNRLDLLSLAALTARGCRLVAEGAARAAGADQCLALGGLYERAGRINDALECYRHAVEGRASDDDDIRADALCRLARWSRRTRQYEAATRDWTRILELPAAPARIVREAVEALAIHHEHRVRDFTRASAFARRALNLDMTLTLNGEVDSRRRAAARHRLARLDRKQQATAGIGRGTRVAKPLDT